MWILVIFTTTIRVISKYSTKVRVNRKVGAVYSLAKVV